MLQHWALKFSICKASTRKSKPEYLVFKSYCFLLTYNWSHRVTLHWGHIPRLNFLYKTTQDKVFSGSGSGSFPGLEGFLLGFCHSWLMTHGCLKVHGGVPIVLCIFFYLLEPRIICLVIREWLIALFLNPESWSSSHEPWLKCRSSNKTGHS